jgi:glycosyltransferase involved in cell wall biosynthesis
MNKFKYETHRYIELFAEAGRFSKYSITLTSYSDIQLPKLFARFPGAYQLANLAYPFGLAAELRKRRRHDAIFVREFMTIPLLLAAPVLWRYRKNTLFVITHNTQMAHSRLRDRLALKLLFRLGFRFVSLESDAGVRLLLGKSFQECQLLTLPLAHYAGIKLKSGNNREKKKAIVGVVGRMRPEKNIEVLFDILEKIMRSHDVNVDVLVGCDNTQILNEGKKRGFRTLDTTTIENYDDALRLSDVILLNYDVNRYLYRDSAVIADAIFRGTVVVCPDYPTFKAQVSIPCPVGTTFRSLADLPQAIERAVGMAFGNRESFHEYIHYRQAEGLARKIDEWLEMHA